MEQSQRFLEHVARMLGELPYMFTDGAAEPPDDCPWAMSAIDTTIVRREYALLPELLKHTIEPEWVELGVLLHNTNAVQGQSIDLYRRIADKLNVDLNASVDADEDFDDAPTKPLHRHNGHTRLTVVRNEAESDKVLFVGSRLSVIRQTLDDRGDVALTPLPELPHASGREVATGPIELPDNDALSAKRHFAVIGGTLAAVAAFLLGILVPDGTSSRPTVDTAIQVQKAPSYEASMSAPLPINEKEIAVCEPIVRPTLNNVPASQSKPAISAPKRKSAQMQFVSDIDTLVLTGKNKPTYQLTLTKVPTDEQASQASPPSPSRPRVRTVDLDEMAGFEVQVGVADELSVILEVAQ